MTCHRIGCSPMGTIGLGRNSVSSLMRVPRPPHRMKTGMLAGSFMTVCRGQMAVILRPHSFFFLIDPGFLLFQVLSFARGEFVVSYTTSDAVLLILFALVDPLCRLRTGVR